MLTDSVNMEHMKNAYSLENLAEALNFLAV